MVGARAFAREARMGQADRGDAVVFREIEADHGFLRLRAYQRLVGRIAQDKSQRIQQNRFTGTGFPRQDGKPVLNFKNKFINDNKLFYGKLF